MAQYLKPSSERDGRPPPTVVRHEQIQRASDARFAATAAMTAAAAEAALAAQAKALIELEEDCYSQKMGGGHPCTRLGRSCPFVKHVVTYRQAVGLPCAAPVPCEKHWRQVPAGRRA